MRLSKSVDTGLTFLFSLLPINLVKFLLNNTYTPNPHTKIPRLLVLKAIKWSKGTWKPTLAPKTDLSRDDPMLFQSHEQCLKNLSKNGRMEPNSNHLVPLDPKMVPLAAGIPQALLNLLATIPVTRYVEIVTFSPSSSQQPV